MEFLLCTGIRSTMWQRLDLTFRQAGHGPLNSYTDVYSFKL